MSIFKRISALWGSAKAAPAQTRAHFSIPAERVSDEEPLGEPFAGGEHYFQAYVNELYLQHARQWFVNFDPMAFVATQYVYDRTETTAAFVVGPKLLEEFKDADQPLGMIFRNTPVTGLHPYQGGEVQITVLLSRVPRQNNADHLLGVLEGVAKAVDPSTTFATYVKLGGTIMDGVEALLGLDGTQPVLGYRVGVNPAVGLAFEPGYQAILDKPDQEVDVDSFHVKNSRLHVQNGGGLEPYRGSDFLLFSVRQGTTRDDERELSFYELWQAAQDLAAQPGDHFWEEAKHNFNALKRAMLKSPDLTLPDYKRLRTKWLGELKDRREEAVLDSDLKGAAGDLDPAEAELRDVARELDSLD